MTTETRTDSVDGGEEIVVVKQFTTHSAPPPDLLDQFMRDDNDTNTHVTREYSSTTRTIIDGEETTTTHRYVDGEEVDEAVLNLEERERVQESSELNMAVTGQSLHQV